MKVSTVLFALSVIVIIGITIIGHERSLACKEIHAKTGYTTVVSSGVCYLHFQGEVHAMDKDTVDKLLSDIEAIDNGS